MGVPVINAICQRASEMQYETGQSLFSLFAHSPAHATRDSRLRRSPLKYHTHFLAVPPAGILEQKRDCSQSRNKSAFTMYTLLYVKRPKINIESNIIHLVKNIENLLTLQCTCDYFLNYPQLFLPGLVHVHRSSTYRLSIADQNVEVITSIPIVTEVKQFFF